MTEFPKAAIEAAVEADVEGLEEAHGSYGDSWKKRGGVGAFMMLARKWDRLENAAKKHGYDVFKAIAEDERAEGIMDDIRDLRRYLVLVEAEFEVPQAKKGAPIVHRDGCLIDKYDALSNATWGCTCGAFKGPAITPNALIR